MRFITCRLPDGIEDPAILSADGRQVWPLSWLGLRYETLSDAIPFLTPQVRAGLSLAIAGIPALPIEAVTLESPIPAPAQDVICLGINYMAHSDEAEKYSADAFATRHQDAIYFSKRVTRAVPDGGFIEGQRMAVFDECFGTGGLSGVDGNRLFIRLGEVVDRFEALVGNVDGIISRIEFDADAGIPF